TLAGQLQFDSFPQGIFFHPVLDLVGTIDGNVKAGISVFNAKSFVKKDSFMRPKYATPFPSHIVFGAEGTKMICAFGIYDGKKNVVVLASHPITLTDEQRDALKKASGN